MMDSHFAYAFPDRRNISKIAKFRRTYPGDDTGLSLSVSQI